MRAPVKSRVLPIDLAAHATPTRQSVDVHGRGDIPNGDPQRLEESHVIRAGAAGDPFREYLADLAADAVLSSRPSCNAWITSPDSAGAPTRVELPPVRPRRPASRNTGPPLRPCRKEATATMMQR